MGRIANDKLCLYHMYNVKVSDLIILTSIQALLSLTEIKKASFQEAHDNKLLPKII